MFSPEILFVFIALLISLILFTTDWLRYDIVALIALLSVSVTGILTPEEAFSGFGESAVIVVAAVLVISRGINNAGIADLLATWLVSKKRGIRFQLGLTNGIVSSLSGIMSDTGTLALFLPLVVKIARQDDRSPSLFLMPLAASSLLGGLITLIGTPPNLIIASFRGQTGADNFSMFDFTPVGIGVAVAGLLFIILVGWRFVPHRDAKSTTEELFEIERYLTEVRVSSNSKLVGKTVEALEDVIADDIVVGSLEHDSRIRKAPSIYEEVQENDVLLLQINPDHLGKLVAMGLEPTSPTNENDVQQITSLESNSVELIEAIVLADSPLVGKTVINSDIRRRHGINLLGVARHDARIEHSLAHIKIHAGDILLFQGHTKDIDASLPTLGCIQIQKREITFNQPRRLMLTMGIFVATLIIVTAGLVAVEVGFVLSAVVMILLGLVSLDEAYDAIHWPILVLIGAMLPLGTALEKTGGAALIADGVIALSSGLPPLASLTILFVMAMLLSNLVHNAAVATLFAPVALNLAHNLGVSSDPFLMAVAVAASCTFLTPIGHQVNTIVMEVGGYKFRDYWRLGLPLSVVVTIVAIPLIIVFWPLNP